MTSSVPSTPRSNQTTNSSRTPRRLCRQSIALVDTPECLKRKETPRRRVSKEKCEVSNVFTVSVRVRPMNNRELNCSNVYDTIAVDKNELIVKYVPPGTGGLGVTYSFQYDYIFCPDYTDQNDVFITIGKPILVNAFKGYNGCLFAYGQTGSGKSYSMMGEDCNIDYPNHTTAGIIPRFSHDLFEHITKLPTTSSATVEISYFEIYNEKIYDLLAMSPVALDRKTPLKVREHPVWGPYVVNLSSHLVNSFDELKNLLQLGNKHRATATTALNEKSSRSHSIVSIELSVSEIHKDGTDAGRRSKISLVDLAGSERVGNSHSSDDRHREGVSINQSLLTLGKVISALADPKKTNNFIPYRESSLTWLLRESLGGNSLTSMLATISPASNNIDETLATLRYACQARSIVNRAYVNENPHDRLIRELRAEVDRLRALRQDYERQSLTPVSQADDSQELNDLRQKLSETEQSLETAQKAWERRFLETKQKQLQELAEAEKRKEELESHVRVMSTLDHNIAVSPYKSNFLEELEDMLVSDKENLNDLDSLIKATNEWCDDNNLFVNFSIDSSNQIIVKDTINNLYAECSQEHLENRFQYNNTPVNFLNNLKWRVLEQSKKIIIDSVSKYLQQIHTSSNAIKSLVEEDENLLHSFNQLDTALNTFASELNKSRYKRNVKKVKFQT